MKNLWQQTRCGLKAMLLPHNVLSLQFMDAPPLLVRKLFSQWTKEDLQALPVKGYLLEGHIEMFCLEAIWYHMQAVPCHFTKAEIILANYDFQYSLNTVWSMLSSIRLPHFRSALSVAVTHFCQCATLQEFTHVVPATPFPRNVKQHS